MRLIHNPSDAQLEADTVLTVGAYDGLHLGHQELVRRLITRARATGRLSGMVTFEPMPRAVLNPGKLLICLTTLEDKIALLEQWGLDTLVVLAFTQELRHTSPRDFAHMLHNSLRMTELWVGEDFALGLHRQGDVEALSALGLEMGFVVSTIAPVRAQGMIISSTQIRNLLFAGKIEEANQLLGRFYHLRGRLEPMPCPPANAFQSQGPVMSLHVPRPCALPAGGLYAARVVLQSRWLRAALSVDDGDPRCGDPRGSCVHLAEPDPLPATPATVELLANLGPGGTVITPNAWWEVHKERVR